MKQFLRSVVALVGFVSASVFAQQAAQATPTEAELASQAAQQAMKMGPVAIDVEQQGALALPKGFGFVPKAEAQRLLEAWGNGKDDSVNGLIFPTEGEQSDWFAVVSWDNTGFIKDDDAKSWDPAEMLQSMKEGTEQMNEERAERGIPAMHVKDWAQVPNYNEQNHQLVWSLIAMTEGEQDEQQATINYNTVLLGREGKISLNVITSVGQLPTIRPLANELLNALTFVPGKTYADFNAETDHVAEYGLAALVAGGLAAKKLGLFALMAAFFAKFAKLIIAGVVALGYGIKTWLGRKKAETTTETV